MPHDDLTTGRASNVQPFVCSRTHGAVDVGWVRVAEYGTYKPLSPFAEQLRALRAGLWLRARQPKVVAITAARPSEGKTTVAVALGRSAALNGERVVVVDCDIRQPSLATITPSGRLTMG